MRAIACDSSITLYKHSFCVSPVKAVLLKPCSTLPTVIIGKIRLATTADLPHTAQTSRRDPEGCLGNWYDTLQTAVLDSGTLGGKAPTWTATRLLCAS